MIKTIINIYINYKMIDQDIKQRIKVIGIFLLQSYKVLTGTMLSIFIPQSCGDNVYPKRKL